MGFLLQLVLFCAISTAFASPSAQVPLERPSTMRPDGLCPQNGPLFPSDSSQWFDEQLDHYYGTADFEARAIEALSEAIKIP